MFAAAKMLDAITVALEQYEMPKELIRQHIHHRVERGSVLPTDHAAFEGGNRHLGSIRRKRTKRLVRALVILTIVAVSAIAGAVFDDPVMRLVANLTHRHS